MSLFGTASGRQRTSPPERVDELAEMVLPDHEATDRLLGESWRETPALLIWLRHYG